MSVAANKLGGSIGVEITGITGHDLVDPEAADKTGALLEEHGVVVYREVHIDDDDLVAFSRMLGEVVVQPTGEHTYPEIQTITSDPAKTSKRMAEYRKGNLFWHFDGAMGDVPQKATLLSAREVDDADQGDTEFATTYGAYDSLSDDEKAEIANLRVVHSFAHAHGRRVGSHTHEGAPAGLDAPQWSQVAADRRHSGRGRRLARRQEPGAPGSPARLVDATAVHPAPSLAPGRSRHLGQHRHAAPCSAVRGDLTPPHASHDARGRGSRRRLNDEMPVRSRARVRCSRRR
jgi:hypothetical protein